MMIGETISHYKILEKLGEGGMGVVYKAHDIKLDRVVALKFLPAESTEKEEDRTRFMQEARAAAKLSHPNICGIYSIGEHENRQFIEMEYVEGQTLREQMQEEQLSLETVIDYALQVTNALDEAHQQEIIHRDIKPENIMVDRKGRVKVMDFGLAKLKGMQNITKAGSTVGTTAYMSPEQIQGGEIDRRADLFSFGVVLYEMLAGQKPFRGEHEAAMMYAIVNEEPLPIRNYLPDIPESLEHIIHKSLAKDPENRFTSAEDMIEELKNLQDSDVDFAKAAVSGEGAQADGKQSPEQLKSSDGSTTINITIPAMKSRSFIVGVITLLLMAAGFLVYYYSSGDSPVNKAERIPVAVTDFVNETGESELDGLSGMLITSLEQSSRLLVMPRSRMFDILDQQGIQEISYIDESLGKQVARAADLRALVTASIHQFGEVYTIDLKILDTQRDEYLFTVSEQGEAKESIPKMLDRLSQQIREDFQGPEQEGEMDSKPVAELTTPNLEAYQYYFKGEELINKLKFGEAEEQFRKAIALDPEFALAYYRLGYARSWRGMEADEYYAKALEFIDKAPLKEQLMIQAVTTTNSDEQIKLLKQVLERYPQEKEALFMLGDAYLHYRGETKESIHYFKRTLEIDPSFQWALQHIVWALGILRDKREIEYARKYVKEVPNREAYYLLAGAYYYHGYKNKAFDTFRQGHARFPEDAFLQAGPGILHMYEDQFDKATEIYRPLIDSNRPEDRMVGLLMSEITQLYQGKISSALETLDKMAGISKGFTDQVNFNLRRIYALQFNIAAAYHTDDDSLVDHYEQKIISHPPNDIYSRFNTNEAYIFLGEFEKIRPLNVIHDYDRYVEGLVDFKVGKYDKVIEKWDALLSLGGYYIYKDAFLYRFANTYMEMERYNEATELAKKISNNIDLYFLTNNYAYSHMFWYPRNLYLLGQIHEQKGDKARALQYYNKFLEQWKDADENLALLNKVKQRAANLQD